MLNPQQLAAVEHCDSPLLVLAGAGSGKTSVITQKIAWLIARKRLAPSKIAAITFTNKAAREMRERVAALVSNDDAQALTVSTFHALGLRFLQIEHERAGLRRGFSVLDADDSGAIVKELAPKGVKNDVLFGLRNLLSQAKNRGLSPEQALAAARSPRELEAATIYEMYQQRLAAFNAVDFDDLIRLPLRILESDAECRDGWRERLRYLLVDEYQDTNDAQYRLLKALTGERGGITCVGDDDQSIYAWRGANPENIDQLGRDWPNLRVIKLEQNYRCGKRILRAANALIANNPHLHEKKLWSEHPEGAPIRVIECKEAEHEAERVAAIATTLAEKHKARWHDIAILYRGNFQARPLEKALRLARVPYHLTGALSFLDRAEVKDLLCYLRLLTNPSDDAAFLRVVNVPKREIGATTLEKLGQMAQSRHSSLLDAIRSDSVLRQLTPRPAAALASFATLAGRTAQRLAAPERRRAGGDHPAAHPLRRADRRQHHRQRRARAQAGQPEGTGRLVPRHAERRQQRRRPGLAAGPAQPRRPRRAGQRGAHDDPARGQGAGVPLRLHRRLRGRHPAARGRHRRGPHRGRAAPDVRGHHPRQGIADAVLVGPHQALRRDPHQPAQPFPAGTAAGGPALAGQGSRSGQGSSARDRRVAHGQDQGDAGRQLSRIVARRRR